MEMIIVERSASKNTQEAYTRDLRGFFQFINKDPKDILSSDIILYLKELTQSGKSTATQSRHLTTLRQYFQFLTSESHISEDPTQLIDLPKKEKSLPKILTIDEVDLLLKTAAEDPSKQGIRLHTMIELMYSSGMRVSELVALPYKLIPEDFTLLHKNKMLHIKGKGGKERLIPLGVPALEALSAYLKIRPHFCLQANSIKAQTFLFPSRGKVGHLSRIRFYQQLKELALKINLNPDSVSPHVIRHAFATHLLQGGANLLMIQKLLGHSDISSTQIYTHIQATEIINLVQQHHPLTKS